MFILIFTIYHTVMTDLVERDKNTYQGLQYNSAEYCQLIQKPDFPEIFSKGRALEVLYQIFQSAGLTKTSDSRFG